jgi:hypothetical protein
MIVDERVTLTQSYATLADSKRLKAVALAEAWWRAYLRAPPRRIRPPPSDE